MSSNSNGHPAAAGHCVRHRAVAVGPHLEEDKRLKSNRWESGRTSGVGTNLSVSLHVDGAVVQPQPEEAA